MRRAQRVGGPALNLGSEELVPVARAFSQFLNLANIADQHHTVSREADELLSASRTLANDLGELIAGGARPAGDRRGA